MQVPGSRPSGRRQARPRSEFDKCGVIGACAACGCHHLGIDLVGGQCRQQGQLRNGLVTDGQLGDSMIDPAAAETDRQQHPRTAECAPAAGR